MMLERIREAFVSRLRCDQAIVGRRFAYALPYHAFVVVNCPLPDVLEELWVSSEDYSYKEDRAEGVLTEVLEYDMSYMCDAGEALVPVIVLEGEEFDVVVEYRGLSEYVLSLMRAKSN